MNRIMYLECTTTGEKRIGRVTFNKSRRTIFYDGQAIHRCKGYKFNHYGGPGLWWISGPKKDGTDALYGSPIVEIDEDVREEYWTEIRKRPDLINETTYRSEGKYSNR